MVLEIGTKRFNKLAVDIQLIRLDNTSINRINMSQQIYIFNPEHDLCIANGDENFVPPRSAVGFANENINLSELLKRPNKQRRQIIPWGWNHSLKKRLINEGIDPATLPS